MKIAFCLAGQPRFFKFCYENLKEHIFDPNSHHEFDFFLHAWYDEADAGKEYDGSPWMKGKTGIAQENTRADLLETYKPKLHIIEKQREFNLPRVYTKAGEQGQHIPYSMFYSVMQANKLKHMWEREHGFRYDWVFRARYDLWLGSKIILDDLDNDFMYIPDSLQANRGQPDLYEFNDMLALSSSHHMDVYGETYNVIDELYTKYGATYVQESLLGKQLEINGIKVKPYNIKQGLIREKWYPEGDFPYHIHWTGRSPDSHFLP